MNRGGGRPQNYGRASYRRRSSRSTTPPHSSFSSDGNANSAHTPLGQSTQRQTSWRRKTDTISKEPVKDISSDIPNLNLVQNSPPSALHNSKQLHNTSPPGSNLIKGFSESGPSEKQPHPRDHDCSPPEGDTSAKMETEFSQTSKEKPFDICQEPSGSGSVVKLKTSLYEKNKEKRKELSRATGGLKVCVLKSGMILLKNYISCEDQVKIVRKCREFGMGKGGFYQPGYRDGAELHLKMMCLGKNWDPETCRYVELRPFDLATPPLIPNEFNQLVKRVIQDSHEYLEKDLKLRNVQSVLPSMSPNLCIVNFYAKSGRLGLHQDKDESPESIRRQLPVVSFSIGDSAEFLYSVQRDVEKAEKVILESGDVLIFGGESRLIFHGVKTIIGNTAPKAMLEESKLRPGRLNLTFREY